MQLTQLSALIVALGVALAVAVLVWRGRVHRLNRESPERQCRRDIQALQRLHRTRVTERRSVEVWSAGAAANPRHSRGKKAATWVAAGTLGGCGGCGGCGCGG
jgi:type II secretory pathway pseudopilin PulG